jgi:hypothetical protein
MSAALSNSRPDSFLSTTQDSYVAETDMILEAYKKLAMGPAGVMATSDGAGSPRTLGSLILPRVSREFNMQSNRATSSVNPSAVAAANEEQWRSPFRSSVNQATSAGEAGALGGGGHMQGRSRESSTADPVTVGGRICEAGSLGSQADASAGSRMMTGRVATMQPNPEVKFELDWAT